MVVFLRRNVALALVAVGALALAGTVGAQPQPASAPGGVGFIGIPDYTSTETGIPFFFQEDAKTVDNAFQDMRTAISKCDRQAYDAAMNSIGQQSRKQYEGFPATLASTAEGRQQIDRMRRDSRFLSEAAAKSPPFPANCLPPPPPGTSYNPGPFSFFLVGGGMVPFSGNGFVTGVDTFNGPGAFLIDNKQGGGSNAVPMVGVRGRLTKQWNSFVERQLDQSTSLNVGYVGSRGPEVFIESGFQTSFGAQSFIQSFSGVNTTPQGFGSNTVNENFQIPILIGVGFPVAGPGPTPVFLDLYGGATISNSTQTLQGRNSGAPAGGGFFAQSTRTTFDPTLGAGVRVAVGDFNGDGIPDLIIGANAEVSFRPGGVVQAQSPNFPSESYYGTVDRRTMAVFMIRVGMPFGGRR